MFRDRLRQLRKKRNMTQNDLANLLHVSQQTIGSWEVGRSFPDEETINKISNFFDVSIDYLYGKDVPSWASQDDVIELEKLLDNNVNMAYGGESLTENEKQRVRDVLTTLFWDKLQNKKEGGKRE